MDAGKTFKALALIKKARMAGFFYELGRF